MSLGSERIFVTGKTGAGKTEFMRRYLLSRRPRLLLVDVTGDWRKAFPEAPRVKGYGATLDALRRAAGRPAWRVITYLSNEEVLELADKVLVPTPDTDRGYSAAVGGMGLVLDEVRRIIPGSTAKVEIQSLFTMGRHARLSVYTTTQSPSSISKDVVRQSEWLVMLRLNEPLDLDYMEERLGAECFRWALPYVRATQYGAVLYNADAQSAWLIDPSGRRVGEWAAPEYRAPLALVKVAPRAKGGATG